MPRLASSDDADSVQVQRLQQQTEELVAFIQVQEPTSRVIQKELVTLEEILAQAHAKNTLLKSQIRLLKGPKASFGCLR